MFLTATSVVVAGEGRGGLMGFIAGCCFGVRTGGDYNEGKEVHWREWVMLVPFVNIVFAIWNGIEGAEGVTMGELGDRYGAMFY
jgi:hypothetical protein